MGSNSTGSGTGIGSFAVDQQTRVAQQEQGLLTAGHIPAAGNGGQGFCAKGSAIDRQLIDRALVVVGKDQQLIVNVLCGVSINNWR